MLPLDYDQRHHLITVSRAHRFEAVIPVIESLAQSCIEITAAEPDDGVHIGGTRIGGTPDLPPNIAWQRNGDKYLVFVAQINLSELPFGFSPLLPSNGRLYFFHGMTEPAYNMVHRVIYDDSSPGLLLRAPLPPREWMIENDGRTDYPAYRVHMRRTITLPFDWARKLPKDFVMPPEDESKGIYPDLVLEQALRETANLNETGLLLGHAQTFSKPNQQHAAQKVHEGKAVFDDQTPDPAEVEKWRLLFEIGSLSALQMQWWDAGFLQYFIHGDDLARHDFTRTYANIETT